MSSNVNLAADMMMCCCASCGKAEIDDVKLMKCACNLVKYCSVECQKNHRPQHKKTCKKRLAELRDDRLFRQPDESHLGECPICCLPMPLDNNKWTINSCCGKTICRGCVYANLKRELDGELEHKCPFCREPVPTKGEEIFQNYMKRIKANDPAANNEIGRKCYREGDYEGAIPYWTKAAALGDMEAHYHLSLMYRDGEGVEKDTKKEIYHLEEAAIGGHHFARDSLGCVENRAGRRDRAMKHFIIAAKLGLDGSLERVKYGLAVGFVSEDDYASALRGHQAAVDATKSEQREEAEKSDKMLDRSWQ